MFFVYFEIQVQSIVGENIIFGPQKHKLLFNIKIFYINIGLEEKLTAHMCQNIEWHCFCRQSSHLQ